MVVVVVLEENEVAADPDQDQAEHFQRTATAYVCTNERMHHTTILQAQGPLAESGRGAGTLAASHLGRWWCQLRRRRVSKVLELSRIPKDIQGVCDQNASFLFAIFKTADYLRYLLLVASASMPVGRNVGRCLYENRFLTGK